MRIPLRICDAVVSQGKDSTFAMVLRMSVLLHLPGTPTLKVIVLLYFVNILQE